jgi:hypothetical protein
MKKYINFNIGFSLFLFLFLSLFLADPCTVSAQNLNTFHLDLVEFKGEVKGHSIHLFWQFDNSSDEKEYVIERAGADANFAKIGTTGIEYNFEDVRPYAVVNYYRLAGVSFDGQKAYSDVIAVEYEVSKKFHVSPNPASDFIEVSFFLEENSAASILIMNQQGVLVEQQEVQNLLASFKCLRINLQNYSQGLYIVRIDQGSFSRTRKFVVL